MTRHAMSATCGLQSNPEMQVQQSQASCHLLGVAQKRRRIWRLATQHFSSTLRHAALLISCSEPLQHWCGRLRLQALDKRLNNFAVRSVSEQHSALYILTGNHSMHATACSWWLYCAQGWMHYCWLLAARVHVRKQQYMCSMQVSRGKGTIKQTTTPLVRNA